jgi:hypothetical protein
VADSAYTVRKSTSELRVYLFVSCTQALAVTVVLPTTVSKFVTPWRWRSMLRRSCVAASPGASLSHTEKRYVLPFESRPSTLSEGPVNDSVRFVVSRLKAPPCASALVTVSTSEPMRGRQPCAVPLSKSLETPLSSGGPLGGAAVCVMVTSSR